MFCSPTQRKPRASHDQSTHINQRFQVEMDSFFLGEQLTMALHEMAHDATATNDAADVQAAREPQHTVPTKPAERNSHENEEQTQTQAQDEEHDESILSDCNIDDMPYASGDFLLHFPTNDDDDDENNDANDHSSITSDGSSCCHLQNSVSSFSSSSTTASATTSATTNGSPTPSCH